MGFTSKMNGTCAYFSICGYILTGCTGSDFQRILRLGLHPTSKQIAKVDRAPEKYHASYDTMLTLSEPSVIPDWNNAPPVSRSKMFAGYWRH